MKLTAAQQKLVEDNLGLVGKVIAQKVRGLHNIPYYTYDDLFQIGCIGLSKAAATDKGGVFSTYAYRLIWNEICDALVYASRKHSKEDATDDARLTYPQEAYEPNMDMKIELYDLIKKAKRDVSPSVAIGIDALLLMNDGYSAKDIGVRYGKNANTITALVSKAKKHLRSVPELQLLYGEPV